MDTNYVSSHIKCTWEEKNLCMETVGKLLDLSNIARSQGLLALEETLSKTKYEYPPLIKIGISLIVDGTDPVIVASVLENYMISSQLSKKEFLDNLIVYHAALAIQQGENKRHIEERLCSLFGIEFIEEFWKHIEEKEIPKELAEFFQQYKEKLSAFDKTELLEFLPGVLDNRSIQRIVREIPMEDLEFAMLGSTQSVVELFLKNLSKHNQKEFFDDIGYIKSLDKSSIEKSQKKILEIITKLRNSCEIIVFSSE